MAQTFVRGNTENAIGGPARVLIAASTYPFPTQLSEIVNLSTYNVNATYGWQEMGITGAPTQLTHAVQMTEWMSEQFGRFRTVPQEWNADVQTEFMEITQNNKVLVMLGVAVADSATREARTNFVERTSIPSYRVAVLFIDHKGLIHASVFPRAQWNGNQIVQQIARGQAQRMPIQLAAYADENVIDASTGQACFRVDFDQY